jgi:glycosyltransferase involved in cell wall biosynthesis
MRQTHVTSSTFFGGPERQMLGLACALPSANPIQFLSFSEGGRCRPFLDRVRAAGFEGIELAHDTPRLVAAMTELAHRLRASHTDILFCHGYKANLVGRVAARRVGIPVVAVSRGWTGENRKVRLYESLDRFHLRFMDRVVCVSDGQAAKVIETGVAERKVVVIRNAARSCSFRDPTPEYRDVLQNLAGGKPGRIIVSAGRLSPEKGFSVLIQAARRIVDTAVDARFVVFGEGELKTPLQQEIDAANLNGRFVLAGYRDDLDDLLPNADVFVLPSYTEGLPNVILEASAAAVPVVATAVGGTPEVLIDGETGHLVPPGDVDTLASRIAALFADETRRSRMGQAGRRLVQQQFTFDAQAQAYLQLAESLCRRTAAVA